jgi:hypothetical protein
MSELAKDFFGVLMAIVGVAILYTLVNPSNKTAQVVQATFSGFGGALTAAMGGSPSYGSSLGGSIG